MRAAAPSKRPPQPSRPAARATLRPSWGRRAGSCAERSARASRPAATTRPGGGPREIFLDRDPDVFADVLRFMRANRLPAAAAADAHRLEDLKTEAEFLCYDALVAACDEALEALERARPTARCLTFHVNHFHDEEGMQQNLVEVDVPKGQVFLSPRRCSVGGTSGTRGTGSLPRTSNMMQRVLLS